MLMWFVKKYECHFPTVDSYCHSHSHSQDLTHCTATLENTCKSSVYYTIYSMCVNVFGCVVDQFALKYNTLKKMSQCCYINEKVSV